MKTLKVNVAVNIYVGKLYNDEIILYAEQL